MKNLINIVDAPCGYGKTSWAIQAMNEACPRTYKFIYVTPFINETLRVKEAITNRAFFIPEVNGVSKSKSIDLHRLLEEERDICMTHALFHNMQKATKNLIKDKNYILILDEVLDVVEQVKIKKDSLNLLLAANAITIKKNKNKIDQVFWNESTGFNSTEYDDIKIMARSGSLMYYNDTALIWNFPCDIFSDFCEVYILTYLFSGQFQRYYYDLHGVNYRYLSVVHDSDGYSLIPYNKRIIHNKELISGLINIYDGKLNDIGNKPLSMSSKWLKTNKLRKQLSKNTYNFLMNMNNANVKNTLWTTYKASEDAIKPKSYASAFLPVNTRATNEYSDRYNLAYLVNRYMNPMIKNYFVEYGVSVNQETWAVSELIQWIWRSRIRNNESINLYIPSKRMRNLLNEYLLSDIFEEVPSESVTNQYPGDWNFA
ncbi:DEAD/DEAH box helicase family protein [Planomicrobium sp. Y74]|uniref:DEAD/DEAH box helicase family protein n=1 Tax=Planomicrobium sp. Y74 TaxID=2478977 RepID=UPI000EF54922|nr:DEAD/DEAH box helicase family protein [Planomicrobium sp. Y74]RLQ91950.1 hypothetical protein D9754_03960 [Planomicrobium sp. Y74]